jgi:hypothetical protein
VSGNRLRLDFEEIRAGLRQLLADTSATGEAGHIVEATANGAASSIRSSYPVRTGNLRDHVTVEAQMSGFSAGAIVINRAKHAAIFENGTQARHTAIGANRGSMPPGHVFVPIVIRKRRQMYEQLKDLLTRSGLQVSGNAE